MRAILEMTIKKVKECFTCQIRKNLRVILFKIWFVDQGAIFERMDMWLKDTGGKIF